MSDFVPLPPPPPPPPGRGQSGGQQRQWRNGGGRGGIRRGRGQGRGLGRGPKRGGPGGLGHLLPHRDGVDLVDEVGSPSENSLCVAVQGCCHGELDTIYDSLVAHQERTGRKVDVLLCCGDFQSLRNAADFHSLAVPPKYRSLGSFCRYYSGERVAPILTIFVGGNHEASQPLQELYYGGWVAPKIYYLGAAGVVRVGGIRIGGISGIYKPHDYNLGRFERPPYNKSTLRSIYHVRNADVFRLKSLSVLDRLDIILSHDWPQGIEKHGNTADLLRRKPYFRQEVQRNELGSPPNFELLQALRPKWWFAAHLHVKFAATVRHNENTFSPTQSTLVHSQIKPLNKHEGSTVERSVKPTVREEGKIGNQERESPVTTQFHSLESSTDQCIGPSLTAQMTQFLSLDKCLPRRHYLSIIHVPTEAPEKSSIELEYDVEWLAILKKTHHLTNPQRTRVCLPKDTLQVTEDEKNWVRRRILQYQQGREIESSSASETNGRLVIPKNFCATVPPHDDPSFSTFPPPSAIMGNPQTDTLLQLLELDHVVTVPTQPYEFAVETGGVGVTQQTIDDNEIDLDGRDSEGVTLDKEQLKLHPKSADLVDEHEICLDEETVGESPTAATAEARCKRARIEEQKHMQK